MQLNTCNHDPVIVAVLRLLAALAPKGGVPDPSAPHDLPSYSPKPAAGVPGPSALHDLPSHSPRPADGARDPSAPHELCSVGFVLSLVKLVKRFDSHVMPAALATLVALCNDGEIRQLVRESEALQLLVEISNHRTTEIKKLGEDAIRDLRKHNDIRVALNAFEKQRNQRNQKLPKLLT
ncbi:hypothetical protein BV22DRAFT_297073 [Leucogyrophana mollusca]|uniref:Uncharacterized protein n=1 Tax=Leucogyrophana mollusca TaxID=85980 RepID=A0ACB8BMS8_9AGAM|nr:hypothetical protein BV22DRAFT_297073 [Leucogyrophana mollusca]